MIKNLTRDSNEFVYFIRAAGSYAPLGLTNALTLCARLRGYTEKRFGSVSQKCLQSNLLC